MSDIVNDAEQCLLSSLVDVSHARDVDRRQVLPGNSRAKRLRVLLVGYLGAGNTGAELRSLELVRALKGILAPYHPMFSALVMGRHHTPVVDQEDVVPCGLADPMAVSLGALVDQHDAVVVCEGSFLKSSFSNVLSGIMVAALARAGRQGKPALAIGCEIGAIDPILRDWAVDCLGQSRLFWRSDGSFNLARSLGLPAERGGDPAWKTLDRSTLADKPCAGGVPHRDYIVVCPVNPFWWPVCYLSGRDISPDREDAPVYAGAFFHTYDLGRKLKFDSYVTSVAMATRQVADQMGCIPVILGMEALDAEACRRVASAVGRDAVIVNGWERGPDAVVGILRRADLVVSSRYHALVIAIPAGRPFVGIHTDERIVHLLGAYHCGALTTPADGGGLGKRILDTVAASRGSDSEGTARRIVETEAVAVDAMYETVRRLFLDCDQLRNCGRAHEVS